MCVCVCVILRHYVYVSIWPKNDSNIWIQYLLPIWASLNNFIGYIFITENLLLIIIMCLTQLYQPISMPNKSDTCKVYLNILYSKWYIKHIHKQNILISGRDTSHCCSNNSCWWIQHTLPAELWKEEQSYFNRNRKFTNRKWHHKDFSNAG